MSPSAPASSRPAAVFRGAGGTPTWRCIELDSAPAPLRAVVNSRTCPALRSAVNIPPRKEEEFSLGPALPAVDRQAAGWPEWARLAGAQVGAPGHRGQEHAVRSRICQERASPEAATVEGVIPGVAVPFHHPFPGCVSSGSAQRGGF